MPMGIPPNLPTLLLTYKTTTIQAIQDFITYIQIPEGDEYTTSLVTAYHDVIAASKSTYHLAFLTCRPFVILTGLFLHYIWIVLKVLGAHTVHHGYVAACEGYVQLKIGARWFINFQMGLSRGAIAAECGVMAALVAAYLLRRYIQKKRYVERVRRWYGTKRRATLQKYNGFVQKVSQTSLFLAMILPHILYITLVSLLQYIASPVVAYFATKTYLTTAISLWYPLVKTILLLHRWTIFATKHAFEIKKKEAMIEKNQNRTVAAGSNKRFSMPVLFSGFTSKSKQQQLDKEKNNGKGAIGTSTIVGPTRAKQPYAKSKPTTTTTTTTAKSKLGQRWLAAAGKSSSAYPTENTKSINAASKSNNDDDASNKKGEDTLEILANESLDLLQYWIVYALLCAIFSFLSLLPIVGTLITPVGGKNGTSGASSTTSSSARVSSRWGSSRRTRAVAERFSYLRVSVRFAEQVKMFFFIWLRLLPTSLTGSIRGGGAGVRGSVGASSRIGGGGAFVKSQKLAWDKKISGDDTEARSNRPLDIIYRKIVPAASGAVKSSVHLLRRSSSMNGSQVDENEGSILRSVVQKLGSFLDLAVLVRLISKETKENIISVLVESTSLAPAAVTLGMPGYFTQYGCIYVSSVVPAAHSSQSYSTLSYTTSRIQDGYNDYDEDEFNSDVDTAMRYLQYWVLFVLLRGLLSSFEPLLAWVPLSVHLTWLLWAYVSWESTTKMLYDVLGKELIAFGILRNERHPEGGDEDKDGKKADVHDLDKTITVRLIRSLANRLPSGVDLDTKIDNEDSDKGIDTNDGNISPASSTAISSEEDNGVIVEQAETTSEVLGKVGNNNTQALPKEQELDKNEVSGKPGNNNPPTPPKEQNLGKKVSFDLNEGKEAQKTEEPTSKTGDDTITETATLPQNSTINENCDEDLK